MQVLLALSCPTVLRFAKVTPTGLLFPEGGCSVNSLRDEPRAPLAMEGSSPSPQRPPCPQLQVGTEQCRQPDQGVIPADSGQGGEQTLCRAVNQGCAHWGGRAVLDTLRT